MMTGASPVLVPREDPVGKIVFAVVAFVFGVVFFVALMTLLAAVFRGQTGRCRTILAETPFRALLAGAVGSAVLGGAAWTLFRFAFIRRLLETEIVPSMLAAAIAVTVLLLGLILTGAPGVFAAVGDRLELLHGKPMSGLTKAALGTLVSALAGWFPVLGWCLLTPVLVVFSFGAGVLALAARWTGSARATVELESDENDS